MPGIATGIELGPRTTLGVGGRARFFCDAETEEEVLEALSFAEARKLPVWVLGGGSNVVVPDAGLDGLVLSPGLRGVRVEPRGEHTLLTAWAGEPWDELVLKSVDLGLQGLECLSGIPGWCGAAPIQNVGAYGQEVKDTLFQVRAYDRAEHRVVELSPDTCALSYRDSRFRSLEPGRFLILTVVFALNPGTPPTLRYPELSRAISAAGPEPSLALVRDKVLELRRGKSMLLDPSDPNHRSCGSFFVNPVVEEGLADQLENRSGGGGMPRYPQPDGRVKLSAAWLIERAGFPKGTRAGRVGTSTRHALALICRNGASATELLEFAARVTARVRDRFGVTLTPEPVIW